MFTLLLTCVFLSDPSTLEGKVVRIADGDTITVLADRKQVRVRLSSIGRGDLGVNRKRMEQIRQAFQQQGSP